VVVSFVGKTLSSNSALSSDQAIVAMKKKNGLRAKERLLPSNGISTVHWQDSWRLRTARSKASDMISAIFPTNYGPEIVGGEG
jgi:hypothetical protein